MVAIPSGFEAFPYPAQKKENAKPILVNVKLIAILFSKIGFANIIDIETF
jgi:hypothetical protein